MIKKSTYYLFLSLAALYLTSCAGSGSSPNIGGQETQVSSDPSILARKTDEILQMLSTRQYDGLTGMIEPDDLKPPGVQIARCLLAPKDISILLSGWNAGDIQVLIQDSLLYAHTTVPVRYKTHPNRKSLRGELTFYFYRRSKSGPWLLLPCPDAISSPP